jgi:hypothetical protein
MDAFYYIVLGTLFLAFWIVPALIVRAQNKGPKRQQQDCCDVDDKK